MVGSRGKVVISDSCLQHQGVRAVATIDSFRTTDRNNTIFKDVIKNIVASSTAPCAVSLAAGSRAASKVPDVTSLAAWV